MCTKFHIYVSITKLCGIAIMYLMTYTVHLYYLLLSFTQRIKILWMKISILLNISTIDSHICKIFKFRNGLAYFSDGNMNVKRGTIIPVKSENYAFYYNHICTINVSRFLTNIYHEIIYNGCMCQKDF